MFRGDVGLCLGLPEETPASATSTSLLPSSRAICDYFGSLLEENTPTTEVHGTRCRRTVPYSVDANDQSKV